MRHDSTFFVLLAVLVVAPAIGQEHPALQRGFAADSLYQLTDLDQVNLMNGGLSITLPMGGSYPIGGELAFGLTLTYSSKLWDFEEAVFDLPGGGRETQIRSSPAAHASGGFGWTLTLGELLPPDTGSNETDHWQYLSPDWARHGFWPTLHPGDTPDAAGKVLYTRDSTYLRLTELTGGDRLLEFPDGRMHTFSAVGRLKQIEDRFGNYVDVTYPSGKWLLTDRHGRQIEITFQQLTSDGASVAFVQKITVPAFNGTTAEYSFTHTSAQVPYAKTDTFHDDTAQSQVQQLTSISLPDGSKYAMTYHADGEIASLTLPTLGKIEYDFTLYEFPTEGCDDGFTLEWAQRSKGIAGRTFYAPGETDSLGEWRYLQTTFGATEQTGFCDTAQGELDPAQVSRTEVRTPLGDRSRHYFSVWPNPLPTQGSPDGFLAREYGLPIDRRSADSTGNRFLSSQVYDCPASCADPDTTCGVSQCTLARSTYVRYEYERPCDSSDPSSLVCDEANRRLASQRTVYHDDGGKVADVTFSDHDGLGHYRTTTTDGTFPSGNVRTTTTAYNPGHDLVLNDNLGVESGYTMWSESDPWVLDTYISNDVTEGGVTATTQACFDSNTGFLKRQRVQKGDARGGTDVVVERTATNFGDLERELTYGSDRAGFAVPTGINLCALDLTTDAYGVRHTYIDGARRTSRYLTASGADLGHLTLDRTIDESTSLPSAVRDVSGIETKLEYDDLGRLVWEKPAAGHGAWVQYTYTAATSAAAPARVRIRYRPNGSTTATLAQEEVRFDGFGRVAQERRWMPGLDWVARDFTYDGIGNRTAVTEWYDLTDVPSPIPSTTFLGFDVFGRPATIRSPDGHDVKLEYKGDRVVERTTEVGISRNTSGVIQEAPSTTTEHYDRQGRLVKVAEPASAGVTAEYGYDVGNRLTSVSLTDGTVTQSRTFNYDRRGFLTSESHPEKSLAVTYSQYDPHGHAWSRSDGGRLLAFSYDRAERLTGVAEGDGDLRPLKSFTYGTANDGTDQRLGRLQVAQRYNYVTTPEPIPPGLIFADDFECGDLGAWGAVVGATATTLPTKLGACSGETLHHEVLVTESYEYRGVGGRPSQRDTAITLHGATGETFTQGWTYTDLGQVDDVSYPRCDFSRCTSDGAGTVRTVSNTYSRGYLSGITGYLPSIGYHASGYPNAVYHSNGVRDVHTEDPHGMARPARITARSNTGPNGAAVDHWTTGTYSFDGSGNIVGMGRAYFLYDPVQRLKTAALPKTIDNTGILTEQSYAYDAFGNIQSLSGPVPHGRNTPTSSNTNRLQGTAIYDLAGNLTGWNGASYDYDELDMMVRMRSGEEDWTYIYTADDERLWQYDGNSSPAFHRYTLRDLGGAVLREYTADNDVWTIASDYVYRGTKLLAADTPAGRRHFHLDHLGTPRLITDDTGATVAYHAYLPFGEELTDPFQDEERMKFTGHERDLASPEGVGDDLDYMHARYYGPLMGRFLSVDPGRDWDQKVPHSWNLYSYARDNPLRFTDPTGRCADPGGKGTRICIQTFIPSPTFGPFRGDGRGAQPDGGTFRTSQFINVSSSDNRALISESFTPGVSETRGVSVGREAAVGERDVLATADGLRVSVEASDGLLFGIAPDLRYELTLTPTGGDGNLTVGGTHTAFPSLEVWVYRDGEEPQLIYSYDAPASNAVEGVIDINKFTEIELEPPPGPR